ncbi:putative herpesvirus replicative-like helicase [Namao virus]|nr:putative herpesvirus replicative-like helicase [Namao virus]
MRFFLKKHALEYYETLKNKRKVIFFQEDKKSKNNKYKGNKYFHIDTIENFYKRIQKSADAYFDGSRLEQQERPKYYESWTGTTPIKFTLDMDMPQAQIKTRDDAVKLVFSSIAIVKNTFYLHFHKSITDSNIFILESAPNLTKFSFHVIFKDIVFDTVDSCAEFYQLMSDKYPDLHNTHYLDPSIYRLTCLRTIFSYKMDRDDRFIPFCHETASCFNMEYNAADSLSKREETKFDYFMNTLITKIDSTAEILTLKKPEPPSNKKSFQMDVPYTIDLQALKTVLDQFPPCYYEDYELWLKIGIILYNVSNQGGQDDPYFFLWDHFSQKSSKYTSVEDLLYKWNSFNLTTSNKKITMGTLLKWAKNEKIDVSAILPQIDDVVNEYVEVVSEKVVKKNGFISNKLLKDAQFISQKQFPIQIYDEFLADQDKTVLFVQSEKGTGKTYSLIHSLYNIDIQNKSILFVSSRITFGYKLYFDLKSHGFALYSNTKDHYIEDTKVICQVDSVLRLSPPNDRFDIVVIDECETMLRYLTSEHFCKNSRAGLIYSSLENYVNICDKVIMMDADLSDRAIKFGLLAKNTTQYKLIVNECFLFSDYSIYYSGYTKWLKFLFDKIKENNRIVIASASNNKAKDIYQMAVESFPEKNIVLISKETRDTEKRRMLLDVNKEWSEIDILIYTPTVCMGVSFEVQHHFDYIFGYGCHYSLSAQEWCQMLHRVRAPLFKQIYITIDRYMRFDPESHVNVNTVEEIIRSSYYLTKFQLHNNIVTKKIVFQKNGNDKQLYYPFPEEPLYQAYLYNCTETINNRENFSYEFFKYARSKKYKIIFMPMDEDDQDGMCLVQDISLIHKARIKDEFIKMVKGITEAIDILNDEEMIFDKNMEFDEHTMHKINRYNMKKTYHLTDIESQELLSNEEFVSRYLNKNLIKWYKNLSHIRNTDSQLTAEKIEIMQKNIYHCKNYNVDNYDVLNMVYNKNQKIYLSHYITISIINLLGFDINTVDEEDGIISMESFGLKEAIEWCRKNKKSIFFVFKFKKAKINSLSDPKKNMSFIKSIIESQYGLKIQEMCDKVKLHTNNIWSLHPDKHRIRTKNIIDYYERDQYYKYLLDQAD